MKPHRTALGLTAMLTFTGTVHLMRPHTFDAALPDCLPGTKRAWEIGSGVAELVCAGLLAVPQTRRLGGLVTAGLFVGVFPGNVHMVQRANTPKRRLATVLRLPLQVPLVWWAWRVVRETEA